MKLQDFLSYKCSYPAHIPFSITWSEDDCVAMATENGVYVTEIHPSQNCRTPTLASKRYFIPCSKFLPTQDCGIDVEELTKVLDQKGMYDLVQDITMSPVILKKKAYVPAVKYLAWSPHFYNHHLRSLLAILSDSGSLGIYYLWRDCWTCGGDVSRLWLEHCKQNWTNDPKDNKEALNELRIRSYKIKFSAFAWGAMVHKSWCDLFAGSYDGTLSIWRINQDIKTRNINVDLVKAFETEKLIISALHCQYVPPQKYILFICYIDGRIASLVLDLNEENTQISQVHILWDEMDKIQIFSGGMFSRLSYGSTSLIIECHIVKGRHLLIFNVNLDGSLKSHNVVSFQDLSITGLASLSQTESLITGYSGNVYILSLKDNIPSLSKLQDSLRTMHYSCNGLALSRSKCTAVLPFSVKSNYDHLAVKDLCNMLWCSLYNIPMVKEIYLNNSGPLSEGWDILEIIRIESILKGSTIAWNLPSEDLDTMDSNKLQKNLALLQLSLLLDNTENEISKEDKKRIEREIQDLIMSCHIFKRVSHLMTMSALNDFEKLSLFLMGKWIDHIQNKYTSKYNHTTTVAATLKEQLNHDRAGYDAELCMICGNEIEDITDFSYAVCRRGHTVPRCFLSMVQCTDIPYYSCYKCNLVAHVNAVSDVNYSCIFCDNVLRLSEMILVEGELETTKEATQKNVMALEANT